MWDAPVLEDGWEVAGTMRMMDMISLNACVPAVEGIIHLYDSIHIDDFGFDAEWALRPTLVMMMLLDHKSHLISLFYDPSNYLNM